MVPVRSKQDAPRGYPTAKPRRRRGAASPRREITDHAVNQAVRIVLADDHPLFRDGVARTLAEQGNYEIVAQCGDADSVVAAVGEHLPDIVILDISMPGGGIEATRRIATAYPAVQILILTVSEDGNDVLEALEAGASSFVLKGIGGAELCRIVRTVHRGGVYVSPELAARMLIDVNERRQEGAVDLFSDLTAREEQILKQVALGQSNKEIAVSLKLSEKTVKHYMTNILQKLQVRNRVEAALKAHDHYTLD